MNRRVLHSVAQGAPEAKSGLQHRRFAVIPRIKETAVKEARIKRAWKGRRDDNMEREKRKSDEVLIVESKNGVC